MDTTNAPSAPPAPTAALLRATTILAAVAVAAGGLLHLRTWDSDYRDIPDGAVPGLWVVKVGFPVNAVASLVVAAALVAVALGVLRTARTAILAVALVLQLGSLGALIASRGPGILGWTEKGYEGNAVQIIVVEVVAAVLLVAVLVLGRTGTSKKS